MLACVLANALVFESWNDAFSPTARANGVSGVHWCRRGVRFNRVPEKVPVKVWGALVQSRVPEKVPGGFGAQPGQVQQGAGEGLGGSSAKPSQAQQ